MLTIIIAVVAGLAIGVLSAGWWGSVWGIICGVIVIMAVQLSIGLLIRKKINAINARIQDVLMEAQKHINKKVRIFQQKPQGNPKTMQKLLEKDQEGYLLQVIETVDAMAPLCIWNVMLKRQMNTMKMIYYYQLRDFKQVDALMPKVMFFDARAVAMKLARMYKNNEAGIDKFFQRKVRKFKGDTSVIVYAVYSWILVRNEQFDAAMKVLADAKKKTGNEVLAANWEALANNNPKRFSNAALADEWYALYLEEPKIKQQRVTKSIYN